MLGAFWTMRRDAVSDRRRSARKKLPRSLRCLALSAVILGLLGSPGLSASPEAQSSASAKERASLAIQTLQSWYDEQTGLYRTTGWWNSANAITTLADYATLAGSHKFDSVFANTFRAAQATSAGFLNKFYDDEGWWALAWIDVYDLTGEKKYLALAESIFADMSGGWDGRCSGGIWWSKDRNYKNAIANELFLSVAAQLAARANSPEERKRYRSWAEREWRWFSHSGMINADHLINDGLDASCTNNHKTIWTYNQGVVLGGLAELSRVNHNERLVSTARSIAEAVLASPTLVDAQDILHEPCEPNCGGDGSQFKGIFVRNLRSLQKVSPLPQYRKFVEANAESIWKGAQPPEFPLGLMWSAPYGIANASTQSSATDLLVAASEIRNE
jgi:predicted alpha-1,6-mannanase (GH76 family)